MFHHCFMVTMYLCKLCRGYCFIYSLTISFSSSFNRCCSSSYVCLSGMFFLKRPLLSPQPVQLWGGGARPLWGWPHPACVWLPGRSRAAAGRGPPLRAAPGSGHCALLPVSGWSPAAGAAKHRKGGESTTNAWEDWIILGIHAVTPCIIPSLVSSKMYLKSCDLC